MDDLKTILCALGGLGLGTLAAFVNARISRRGLKDSTMLAVMGTNAVRMLIDIATLALAYLAIRLFDLPFMVTLIATAVGLTVFGMIFLRKLTKEIMEDGKTTQDGGE